MLLYNSKFQFNIIGDCNDDKFSSFGFYSGSKLQNSPTQDWFQFISFPMNNNKLYCLQIGWRVQKLHNIIIYMRFKDEENTWDDKQWKQIASYDMN